MFLDSSKIQFSAFQDADLFVKLEENSHQREPGESYLSHPEISRR